jgi:anthranilate synthase component 2
LHQIGKCKIALKFITIIRISKIQMRILLVDCFDSFTFNLVHLIEKVCFTRPVVVRANVCSEEIISAYDAVVFSPGPGLPSEMPNLLTLVSFACRRMPVLGVCLGHQAIAMSFGGEIYQHERPFHGVSRKALILQSCGLFDNIDSTFDAGSYHSWSVDFDSLNEQFIAAAVDLNGQLLVMKHKTLPVWGIQFHPESVLSPQGETILLNWIEHLKIHHKRPQVDDNQKAAGGE